MRRLAGRHHVIAPDYPGFGQSPPLVGRTTFERVADTIDAFTEAKDLDRFSLYMFDFGAPVGFRIASRHPERVQGLVLQNGNAYEVGLGRACRHRGPTGPIVPATRRRSAAFSPSMSRARSPALLAWGRNDGFFPPEGPRAYLDDLPAADLHLLDTGHFATATHNAEIAQLITAFLDAHIVAAAAARD